MAESMADSALALLTHWKFSIIPVGKDKKPLIGWKEFQSRFPTPEEVRGWWREFPTANIGIVTGSISDLLVVDIDIPEAIEEVEKYIPEGLVIPWVSTPRGQHLYFRNERGVSNRTKIIEGVDVRSEGGYVVAPPSIGYKWEGTLDLEIPAIPRALLDLIKPLQPVTTCDVSDKCLDETGIPAGRRDDGLFHAAWAMFKGGASREEVTEAILSMAASCNPPFLKSEALEKVRSAFERMDRSRASSADIRGWISISSGYFSAGDIAKDLGTKNTDNIRAILMRMKSKGEIEPYGYRDGTYRLVSKAPTFEDLTKVEDIQEFPVSWPMGVEDLVVMSRKSVAILAGETNAGKTGFLVNLCNLNIDRIRVTYFSTETTASRFKARTGGLSRPAAEWSKVRFTDKVLKDFHLHIDPEGLNIIDYLEPDAEMLWRIGVTIQQIFDALTTGVAIVAIQKKKGSDFGYGGSFTSFKSEVYLSMSAEDDGRGELKIIKGKTWRVARCNPYLMKRSFYISGGVNFNRDPMRPDWHSGSGAEEKDY